MSPEGYILMAEMFANGELNVDLILEEVRRSMENYHVQQQGEAKQAIPTCFWCDEVIPTPQDAFLDELLTGIFGYWYCSEACRDEHVQSM